MRKAYTFKSTVFVYPGMNAWRFLSIPQKEGKEIRKSRGALARGWGSIPVSVTIGKTVWNSSLFPDKKSASYLLPLKFAVRKAENIDDDSRVSFKVTFR